MLKRFLEFVKQLFLITKRTEENAASIKEHQQQIIALGQELLSLKSELRLNQANETHEREKLVLRLENILLRSGLNLHSSDRQDELLKQIEALKQENEELRKRIESKREEN